MTTPHIASLDHVGRTFLLGCLQFDILLDRPITAESWREAYGRAADYQTVVAARTVLAASERVAS